MELQKQSQTPARQAPISNVVTWYTSLVGVCDVFSDQNSHSGGRIRTLPCTCHSCSDSLELNAGAEWCFWLCSSISSPRRNSVTKFILAIPRTEFVARWTRTKRIGLLGEDYER